MKPEDLARYAAIEDLSDADRAALSMDLIAAATARSQRSCNSCSQCCKTLSINAPELTKPMHLWCQHCKPGKGGCSIYATKPNVCKAFACAWLINAGIDEFWFPAKSKVVIHYHCVGPQLICALVVDADYPLRWREQPFHSGIMEAALAGLNQRGAGRFVTHVEIGPRKILILPTHEVEVGSLAHTVVQTGNRQWDVLVFKSPEQAAEVIGKANLIIDLIATFPEDQRDTMMFELNRTFVAKFGPGPRP